MAAASELQQRRAQALAAVDPVGNIYTGGEPGTAGILYGNAPRNVRWQVTPLGIAAIDLCATPPQADAIAADVVLRVRVTATGDLSFTRYNSTPGAVRWAALSAALVCVAAIQGIDDEGSAAPLYFGQDVVGPRGLSRVVGAHVDGTYDVQVYGEPNSDRVAREDLAPC